MRDDEQPREIDAQPFRDYRAPGRKGEPVFAPGGLAFLVSTIVLTLLAIWLRDYITPIADWLFPGGRPSR